MHDISSSSNAMVIRVDIGGRSAGERGQGGNREDGNLHLD